MWLHDLDEEDEQDDTLEADCGHEVVDESQICECGVCIYCCDGHDGTCRHR